MIKKILTYAGVNVWNFALYFVASFLMFLMTEGQGNTLITMGLVALIAGLSYGWTKHVAFTVVPMILGIVLADAYLMIGQGLADSRPFPEDGYRPSLMDVVDNMAHNKVPLLLLLTVVAAFVGWITAHIIIRGRDERSTRFVKTIFFVSSIILFLSSLVLARVWHYW